MKNVTILFALMMIGFSTLNAQFMVGPKVGIGLAYHGLDENFNDLYDNSAALSYSAGIKMRIPLFSGLELMPEISYSKRGGKIESELPFVKFEFSDGQIVDGFHHVNRNMSYIDIPLLLNYKFRGKEFAPYIFMGPTIGIAIHGNESNEFLDENDRTIVKLEDDMEFGSGALDEYSRSYFSMTLGGGFYYELEVGRLAVDLRYNIGTSNIFNEGYIDYPSAEIKNRDLMISVGYLFSFSEL